MKPDKLENLVRALIRQTEQGKVHWEATPSENIFRAWIGDGGVKIAQLCEPAPPDEGPGTTNYGFWVLNDNAEVVDEIEQNGGLFLETLYRNARRNAKRADQVVENLLEALNNTK